VGLRPPPYLSVMDMVVVNQDDEKLWIGEWCGGSDCNVLTVSFSRKCAEWGHFYGVDYVTSCCTVLDTGCICLFFAYLNGRRGVFNCISLNKRCRVKTERCCLRQCGSSLLCVCRDKSTGVFSACWSLYSSLPSLLITVKRWCKRNMYYKYFWHWPYSALKHALQHINMFCDIFLNSNMIHHIVHIPVWICGLLKSKCILNLNIRWRWVVSLMPWSPCPQGKSSWHSLDRRLGGLQSLLRCCGGEKVLGPASVQTLLLVHSIGLWSHLWIIYHVERVMEFKLEDKKIWTQWPFIHYHRNHTICWLHKWFIMLLSYPVIVTQNIECYHSVAMFPFCLNFL
jgi:hypothetical protein